MGDIIFHLEVKDTALVQRRILGMPLTEAEYREALVIEEMIALNNEFAKADTQKSADGYGVEDRNKV